MSFIKLIFLVLFLVYSGSAISQRTQRKNNSTKTIKTTKGTKKNDPNKSSIDLYAGTVIETPSLNYFKVDIDSLTRTTDSLITQKQFLEFEVLNTDGKKDSSLNRKFYIDTLNRFIINLVFDTAFTDYYNRQFNGLKVYYFHGHAVKVCWYSDQKELNLCSFSTEGYTSMDEDYFKLPLDFTQQTFSLTIRQYIASEIHWSKHFQKKYSKQSK